MSSSIKDVNLPSNFPETVLLKKHIDFINEYGKNEDDYEYGMTDYLRVSGMYWGLTALELMNAQPTKRIDSVVDYIRKCQDPESGGISACLNHDPHILHTLSAIQVNPENRHLNHF